MRLYTFETEGRTRVGAEVDGKLVDLRALDPSLPANMMGLVQGGPATRKRAFQALEAAQGRRDDAGVWFSLDRVRVRAPLPRPGKILCSGINYLGHLKENPKAKMPEEPFFFSKVPSAVIGPGDPIVIPPISQQVDYEVELAVIIGQRLSRAPESAIMGAIFGYSILHDVSARDVQFKDNQITLGKNFDTFSPMGPCIVTADEVPHPESLKLRSSINGELRQDGGNDDWVFPLPKLLSFLSNVMTLEPGDVVSTGTPAGVGYFSVPQRFLRSGDRVTLEIPGIGRLENPVTAGSAF